MTKIVGRVSLEERDVIKKLFERKNGLFELARVLTPENELYDKLVADLGATSTQYQKWWDDMAAKYHWEASPNGKWSINFDTCEISLE